MDREDKKKKNKKKKDRDSHIEDLLCSRLAMDFPLAYFKFSLPRNPMGLILAKKIRAHGG